MLEKTRGFLKVLILLLRLSYKVKRVLLSPTILFFWRQARFRVREGDAKVTARVVRGKLEAQTNFQPTYFQWLQPLKTGIGPEWRVLKVFSCFLKMKSSLLSYLVF